MGVFSFLGGGEAKPEVAAAAAAVPEVKKTPNCKICCACPDTRSARDTCVITTGAENCKEQIEAHYACLLTEGFSEEQVNKLRARASQ